MLTNTDHISVWLAVASASEATARSPRVPGQPAGRGARLRGGRAPAV